MSRALIATVGVDDAVSILVSQFSWDVVFNAVAHIEGADGQAALWHVLQALVGTSDV